MNKLLKKSYLILLLILLSCGGGTSTGNPIEVNMEFATYNETLAKRFFNLIIKDAHAALSDFKMCFKRMRFKVDSGAATSSNVDLALGEQVIKKEGTPLGTITINDITYKRIEFDLESNCDGGTKPSVSITNGNGFFTTNDKITIKFDGEYLPSNGDLTMFIQTIVNQVKNYQVSDGSIKDVMEAASGSF